MLRLNKSTKNTENYQSKKCTTHDSRGISHDKQARLRSHTPYIYTQVTLPTFFFSTLTPRFPPHLWLLHDFSIFSVLFLLGTFYFCDLHMCMDHEPKLERQKNSNVMMEGQLLIQTRPESPVRAIITTSSFNSSQQISTPQHSVVVTSGLVQRNSNENGNGKNRICRDFVRGSCRRLYCKYPHVQSNDLIVFCHDFQNNKCPRINCK
jgi:hypothetical protein